MSRTIPLETRESYRPPATRPNRSVKIAGAALLAGVVLGAGSANSLGGTTRTVTKIVSGPVITKTIPGLERRVEVPVLPKSCKTAQRSAQKVLDIDAEVFQLSAEALGAIRAGSYDTAKVWNDIISRKATTRVTLNEQWLQDKQACAKDVTTDLGAK